MEKNVASQKVYVFAFDTTNNTAKTGDAANITAYIAKDFGAVTQLGDTSATEVDSTNAPGYYVFDATQTETNANVILVSGKSSTANIAVIGAPAFIKTDPPNLSSLTIANSCVDADIERLQGSAIATPTTAGVLEVDVTHYLGTAAQGASGRPQVDVELWNGSAVASPDSAGYPVVTIKDGTGQGELNITSGIVDANARQFAGQTITCAGGVTVPAATLASTTNITAGTITTATNVTTVNGLAANVITAAATAADFGTEVANAVLAADPTLIRTGTAQAGAANSITLDASASATDGIYDPSMVILTGGTGVGQARKIHHYTGSSKVAIVDRDWRVTPDNTSVFRIVAADQPISTNEGLAQGGGNTSITLNASASGTNNTYNGQLVVIRTGTGQDQCRIITAYNGTTKVATVAEAWATNPTNASGYQIWPVGRTLVASVATGAITNSSFAASAIDNTALAANAASEIATAVRTELTTELGRIDVATSTRASQTSVDTIDGIVDDILVDTSEIGAAGAGLTNINLPDQTMNITGNITGNLSGSVGSVTGLTASDVGAIKTQTDKLTFGVTNVLNANITHVNEVEVTGDGQSGTEFGPA